MSVRHRFQAGESRDDKATYQFLARDRAWGGYAICDLEPGPRQRSHYWVARDGGDAIAVCLFYQMGTVCSLHTFGDPAGVAGILEQTPDPPAQAWLLAREQHLRAVRAHYEIGRPDRMWRMIATRETFSPTESRARRMDMGDASALEDLYAAPRGVSVRPETILAQTCYGLWEDGRLVSIAGTHGLSRSRGMAAVGNVFTHPEYRNRGYARMCVSALAAELMELVGEIILNVSQKNGPALRLYERVGFRRHCTYREGRATLLAQDAEKADPSGRRRRTTPAAGVDPRRG